MLQVTSAINMSFQPSLAWTGTGYGVAWSDSREPPAEIYFARISAAGAKIGSDVKITGGEGEAFNASLTWTGSEYGLAWEQERAPGAWSVYFRRVASGGSTSGSERQVAAGGVHPSMAWTGDVYGVAWLDRSTSAVRFSVIDRAGVPVGYAVEVGQGPVEDQWALELAWHWREFGLVWPGPDSGPQYIYFARVSAGGEPVGEDVQVSPSQGQYPAIAWNGKSYGVAWTDSDDIYLATVGCAP